MTERHVVDVVHAAGGGVMQTLAPGTTANLSFTATTASVALPTAHIVRLAVTEDCYVKFGTSGVTATTTDVFFPKGAEVFAVPSSATHIAAIRLSTSGSLNITAMGTA